MVGSVLLKEYFLHYVENNVSDKMSLKLPSIIMSVLNSVALPASMRML